jgi:hypothetical protein
VEVNKEIRTSNPAGSPKLTPIAPDRGYQRDDFFRDLKKVAKKQDRPSRRSQEKR